jgi:hypothetical protein
MSWQSRWEIRVFLSSLGWSGWFLISIPNQFTNRYGEWVQRRNAYGFIPGWTFFAPTPGTLDYRLVYRDVLDDGTMSVWEEVDWCRPRMWMDAVWHPRRYETKLVVDSINGLALVFAAMKKEGVDVQKDQQGLLLSTPYVILLNVVMRIPRQNSRSKARQMALFQQERASIEGPQRGFESACRLMLCSAAHELE